MNLLTLLSHLKPKLRLKPSLMLAKANQILWRIIRFDNHCSRKCLKLFRHGLKRSVVLIKIAEKLNFANFCMKALRLCIALIKMTKIF